MIRERVHRPLPPALVEKTGDVPGDEEFGHGDERVEERTDAEHDEQNLEDLPARRLRRRDRADGRDRIERPDEADPERRVLGGGEAEHSSEEEQADNGAELREAVDEHGDLPLSLRARDDAAGRRRLPPHVSGPRPRGGRRESQERLIITSGQWLCGSP